eukprot:90373-Chlamydomonas_euryale.AAC.1
MEAGWGTVCKGDSALHGGGTLPCVEGARGCGTGCTPRFVAAARLSVSQPHSASGGWQVNWGAPCCSAPTHPLPRRCVAAHLCVSQPHGAHVSFRQLVRRLLLDGALVYLPHLADAKELGRLGEVQLVCGHALGLGHGARRARVHVHRVLCEAMLLFKKRVLEVDRAAVLGGRGRQRLPGRGEVWRAWGCMKRRMQVWSNERGGCGRGAYHAGGNRRHFAERTEDASHFHMLGGGAAARVSHPPMAALEGELRLGSLYSFQHKCPSSLPPSLPHSVEAWAGRSRLRTCDIRGPPHFLHHAQQVRGRTAPLPHQPTLDAHLRTCTPAHPHTCSNRSRARSSLAPP